MSILVTGGAGYIGSHTVLELLNKGEDVVVIDNLSNSCQESLKRVMELTGKKLKFVEGDLLDKPLLDKLFTEEKITSVMHFAGLKAVGESVSIPYKYYHNNIEGTLNLVDVMEQHQCKNLIFSSSATVYGVPESVPMVETDKVGGCTNPYGWTKFMIEEMLMDICHADENWNVVLLRYFNPVGAHESGRIGESPNGIPNNLMPYISQVAVGRRDKLHVYGNDYKTHDGTGVRDYIHVVDLAKGHLAAMQCFTDRPGLQIYNLGTGNGYSVLDMVHAFEKACGHEIPYEIEPRRPGDIDASFCDPKKALDEIGWKAELGIDEMCRDTWRWQENNPKGYEE